MGGGRHLGCCYHLVEVVMKIPDRTLDALVRYVEHGIMPGDFLRAVLRGDLFAAFIHADDDNEAALWEIILWLRRVPPGLCYGSHGKIQQWVGATSNARERLLINCSSWLDFTQKEHAPQEVT